LFTVSRSVIYTPAFSSGGRAVVEIGLDKGEELPLDVLQGVALLGDGVAHHLEGGAAENGFQLLHVLGEGVPRPRPLGNGGHHVLLQRAVGQQRDHQGHVVEGGVNFVDNVIVKGVGGDDAALDQPLVQQPVLDQGDEAPEDVARAEVDPDGILLRLGPHGLPIELGQSDPRLFPGGNVLNALIR
jgi:hypothetical protein